LKLAIVSLYPPKGKHSNVGGVASYTKNLAESLKVISQSLDVFIICDRRPDLPARHVDQGIKVYRTFNTFPFYIFKIFRELKKIRPDVIHIQHEYFLYGGMLSAILFPLLPLFSRLISRRTVVTIHGVIPLNLLEDVEFKKENGIKGPPWLLKIGLWLVTRLIALASHVVIVHEEFLKKYLNKDYNINKEKIIVIPHGVEEVKVISQAESKRRLGLKDRAVVLYFGYLTGYKGIKTLIEAYKHVSKQLSGTTLIIAGGKHPRLKNQRWYRQWLEKLVQKAHAIEYDLEGRGKILFTDFVPEKEICIYYSAADLVVLPYNARISASGPESLAIAYGRPLLITNPYRSYNSETLAHMIVKGIVKKDDYLKRTKKHKRERNWLNIAKKHMEVYINKRAVSFHVDCALS